MSVRVVSKRKGGTKAEPHETVIAIDRGSILGNPYHMLNESDRVRVIEAYRHWLWMHWYGSDPVHMEVQRIARMVKSGQNIALECWCAPCACHGDILVAAINELNEHNVL